MVLICLIALCVFSCKKETVYPIDIIGKWDWIRSSGGIGGSTYTPEITGEKIVLEFTSDSVFRKYINDTLKIESKFSIIDSETIFSIEKTKVIKYGNISIRQSFSFESPQLLTLHDEIYDGYANEYRRIE